MVIQPQQFATHSLRSLSKGEDICKILAAAIHGVDAAQAINRHLRREANHLLIGELHLNLNDYHRVVVIGVGKASIPMAGAVVEIIKDRVASALVITKEGYLDRGRDSSVNKIDIIEAGHPIPDQRNIAASSQLISMLHGVMQDDLAICLLSGGGSALLTDPFPAISLQDIQITTSLLLSCGASITEINTIRKHIDRLKGGGLARLLSPATVVTLILSDVMGDRLDMIASGPTAADPTTYKDALVILERYNLADQIPASVRAYITDGADRKYPETIKPGDPVLERVMNIIVGNNQDALASSERAAQSMGFKTTIINLALQGEASQVGDELIELARSVLRGPTVFSPPACLLAGGETTVTLRGSGLGGRNQELVLGAVKRLSQSSGLVLVSLATDGGDGPTEAAGAVATNETYSRGMSLGLNPQDYLVRNDSYHYFEPLGDLIKTGPTMTNVNDLVFIFAI